MLPATVIVISTLTLQLHSLLSFKTQIKKGHTLIKQKNPAC